MSACSDQGRQGFACPRLGIGLQSATDKFDHRRQADVLAESVADYPPDMTES